MTNKPQVIVVGGGVIGCAVAYELAKRSVDVLLLDKSLPGRATSASAGGLWPLGEAIGLGCGVIYSATQAGDVETPTGQEYSHVLPTPFRDFLLKSNGQFPSLVDELANLGGVDFEYDPGVGLLFLVYHMHDEHFVYHVAKSLPDESKLKILSPPEARQLEPELTDQFEAAVLIEGEHQVNPMLLAEAYKRAAVARGARFEHDVRVSGLIRQGDRVTGVEVDDRHISADLVVNAAGAWAGQLAATAQIDLPIYPVRGQVVLTDALPRIMNACLSTSSCYMLQKKHGEVLIGSTTEEVGFDISLTTEAVTTLCRGAVRAVPKLRHVGVKRIWAGLRPGTPDELPILGPVQGLAGYFNATGGFRTGIVASPLTAQVVAQSVVGETTDVPIEPFLQSHFQNNSAQVLNKQVAGSKHE